MYKFNDLQNLTKRLMADHRIEVKKTREDLREQFRFFVTRRFSINLWTLKKSFFYLTGWTLLLLAFVIVATTNMFIGIKAVFIVMTLLAWIVEILFIPVILVIRFRNLRRADTYVNSLAKEQLNYSMEFDNEKISFFKNGGELDFLWEHYSYYWEYKNSLYILCEKVPMDSIYFSQNEIGENNYSLLKEKANQKLPKEPALF